MGGGAGAYDASPHKLQAAAEVHLREAQSDLDSQTAMIPSTLFCCLSIGSRNKSNTGTTCEAGEDDDAMKRVYRYIHGNCFLT